jgi:hypothetical protein
MRMILASTFSNAFLGGLAVFAFMTQGQFLVWAAVIAWGCFFHVGGSASTMKIGLIGNIWGIICAWVAGIAITHGPVGVALPIWAGLIVFLTVNVMVFVGHQMAIHWKLGIPVVPSCFYGAAATFAYMTQTPGIMTPGVLMSATTSNPVVVLPVSMLIGSILGLLTSWMTEALGTSRATAPASRAAA